MSKDKKSQFEFLYQTYREMVFHLCLGFVKGDSDLAHDLSQEVFINCWKALDAFRKDASYKTWIYRITVNTCLQHIRRDKNRSQVPWQEAHNQLPDKAELPPAQQYQALYHAIGQLNEVDRLIIMMVLEALDYEEIAHITGLSAGNLRVRIHRIKKSLKKQLDYERI